MPCYDPPTEAEEEEFRRLEKQKEIDKVTLSNAEKVEAILCGLVTLLSPGMVVKALDWNKVGVTKEEFETWWKQHQKKDSDRDPIDRVALPYYPG